MNKLEVNSVGINDLRMKRCGINQDRYIMLT
jgi:hypothetical protein